jgi:hypothetical protein
VPFVRDPTADYAFVQDEAVILGALALAVIRIRAERVAAYSRTLQNGAIRDGDEANSRRDPRPKMRLTDRLSRRKRERRSHTLGDRVSEQRRAE